MVPMTLLSADLRYPCWDVPSRCCSDHLVLTPGGIDAGYFTTYFWIFAHDRIFTSSRVKGDESFTQGSQGPQRTAQYLIM